MILFFCDALVRGNLYCRCQRVGNACKKSIGLDAVSFTAPSYFKPANVQMLAECCKEIAAVVPDMPFYYYHIPRINRVGFPMYDLLQAVDGLIPNFAGKKYTP